MRNILKSKRSLCTCLFVLTRFKAVNVRSRIANERALKPEEIISDKFLKFKRTDNDLLSFK